MEGHHEKKKKGASLKKVVIAEVENDGSGKEGCPFHFGLRPYFQNIVPSQEKEIIETVDYLEESDFNYMNGSSRKQCTWDKACIWCGVPLLIAAVIAILFGQLMPPKEPVVARRGSLAYLDRKALVYNSRLELCSLIGLGALCASALMILLSFLISAYSTPSQDYSPVLAGHAHGAIPLSGVITHVQPPSTQVPPKR
ncbi:uncharacterized protein LOC106666046 [Cimex lectularius]|uniref:Uncharacterized protein n=1 Tax=Cimex lectularius TaxID=79782 RepID=A0A8I6RRU8_CIMLE|nr:uncharacterized protein LOC106666046 [Cimex lectularius]